MTARLLHRRAAPLSPPDFVVEAWSIVRVFDRVDPSGADSTIWKAQTATGQFVAVRFDQWYPRPVWQLATAVGRLAHHGAPVCAPLPTSDGLFAIGDAWSVWSWVDGETGVADANTMASLCARLHLAALQVDWSEVVCPEPLLLAFGRFHDHPTTGLFDELLSVSPLFVGHMDLHARNVCVSESSVVAIDWVDAGLSTPALDCAMTAMFAVHDAHPGSASEAFSIADRFLSVYEAASGPAPMDEARGLFTPVSSLLYARSVFFGHPRPVYKFFQLSS